MTEAEQLFEQVYRTYGPSLYRFCLIQMKNPADAEDILQPRRTTSGDGCSGWP